MAHLTEEELNAVRGMHYADGGTYAPVYYPNPKLIAAIHKEWEEREGRHLPLP